MSDKTILVVGTYDTKNDELSYMAECIRGRAAAVVTMDVSVLGDPAEPTDWSKHDVARGRQFDPGGDRQPATRTTPCRSWRAARPRWPRGCIAKAGSTA
jgi:uncharacterized protein (UPF0261 family)